MPQVHRHVGGIQLALRSPSMWPMKTTIVCHPVWITCAVHLALRKTANLDQLNRSESLKWLSMNTKNVITSSPPQINQATNRLDLSQLYGNTDDITDSLRTFHDGKLIAAHEPYSPTLPEIDDKSKVYLCMHNTTMDTVCYRSGDSRVNSNPYLTTLYTVLMRSHNRFAEDLKKANGSWDDEKLFQTARRINTAIYQKIIYLDWTSVVLGTVEAAKINADSVTPKEQIEEVSNEFATAGIRFYYSMMPGDLKTTKDVSYFLRQNNIIIRPMTQ